MIERHKNPDGTYDGAGVMSEVTGLGRGAVVEIWEQVKANNAKLEDCPYHEFEQSPQTAVLRSLTHQKYVCKHCGGEVNYQQYSWHEKGRRPKP
jgi:hypothetical protein